jgi:hypothetical protein
LQNKSVDSIGRVQMAGQITKWAKQKERWSEEKMCMRCFIRYTELGNIGKWECACHKGHKIEVNQGSHGIRTGMGWVKTPDFRWSCCPGVIWSSNHVNGCTPCDHSDFRAQLTDEDTIPRVFSGWIREIKPRPDAIIELDNDYVNIKRVQ